jgi:hypothetical protein
MVKILKNFVAFSEYINFKCAFDAASLTIMLYQGTSINDVPRFLAILTYLSTLSYSIKSELGGYLEPPLPNLISDVINGRSHMFPILIVA